ncbi:major facilitator superfamily domain-containing protein [Mycena capillaripes]|nr:major facilitator superfamily domain-containing protein [Mycena capillaripes]
MGYGTTVEMDLGAVPVAFISLRTSCMNSMISASFRLPWASSKPRRATQQSHPRSIHTSMACLVADDASAAEKDDISTNPAPRPDGGVLLNRLRNAALREVDNANLHSFHVKVCFVAGAGFFTDAYDIFAINIAVIMLGYVYGNTADQNCRPTLSKHESLGLKIATPVGTFFGQLFFGWLADIVGRKRMYGVELIIMIVGTFAQATAGGGQGINIIAMLILWRFIVGLGIGGDYPLSATISSEFASTRIRGRMMSAVFAAQGWGNFAASLVATIITMSFKHILLFEFPPDSCTSCSSTSPRSICPSTSSLDHSFNRIDQMWRLLLGLGCVPAVFALYFRLTIPETPRFTLDIERNIMQAKQDIHDALTPGNTRRNNLLATNPPAEAPRATRRDFLRYFGQWKHLRVLIGTAYSWFAIDVAFYTLGLNASVILAGIGFGDSSDVYKNLYHLCVGNIILSVAGLIPGYWICFMFIDRWGRWPIQMMGFIVLTVLFSIMGFAFKTLITFDAANNAVSTPGTRFFIALFCLANLFQNFGPNTTTFIIPGEIFPTRYRSTGHGISAATGKLGAIVAQIMFNWLVNTVDNTFLDHSFEILALFMLTGVLSTLLVPETKGQSLETLSGEDQEEFMRAPENLPDEHDEGIPMQHF